MGSYTTPGSKLYKPSDGEVGWGSLVRATFDRQAEDGANVKTHGAVLDGVTDDTAAFAAALAASGGRAFIPAGTMVIQPSDIPSNTEIVGIGIGGTTIKQKAGTSGTLLESVTGATNLHIRNLTLDGNKANAPAGEMGILFRDVSRFSIENVRIINAKVDGLYVGGGSGSTQACADGVVSNLVTSGCGRCGVAVTSAKRVTFINPVVESADLLGIDLEPDNTLNHLADITVINATVITSVDVAINVNVPPGFVNGGPISFINPTVLATTGSQKDGFSIQSAPVQIVGGKIANATGKGIAIHSNSVVGGVAGTEISGIEITGCGLSGIQFDNDAAAFPEVVIRDCRIHDNTGIGINAFGLQHSVIQGNRISNNSDTAIRLDEATGFGPRDNVITGNIIFDTQGSPTQTIGVLTANSADRNVVVSNRIANTTTPVSLAGANNTQDHNSLA